MKLRAERKAGGLLGDVIQHGGKSTLRRARLADFGIEYTQSHRWQLQASVPEDVFEQFFAQVKDAGEEITSVGQV